MFTKNYRKYCSTLTKTLLNQFLIRKRSMFAPVGLIQRLTQLKNCRIFLTAEAVVRWCSLKKALSKISPNSRENTCVRVSLFIKKETLAQVFYCKFCKILKNTFFHRTPPADCFCNWRKFTLKVFYFDR